MDYYPRYHSFSYQTQASLNTLDETTIEGKLDQDRCKAKFKKELGTMLDDAKTTEAIARKSRNAYLYDALKRAGKIFGPPAAAIGIALATGEQITGTAILSGIYAVGAKFVDADGLAYHPNPKAGILWTLRNIVPYYQKMVKTNQNFIGTVENELDAQREKKAQKRYDVPGWTAMGP